jgi:hypothetical protein
MTKWISIKDKYPDTEGIYFCMAGNAIIRPIVCFYKRYHDYKNFVLADGTDARISNIKYWMEIPRIIENKKKKPNFLKMSQGEILLNCISSRNIDFMLNVLYDSLKIGESDCFRYKLITRKAMNSELIKKMTARIKEIKKLYKEDEENNNNEDQSKTSQ